MALGDLDYNDTFLNKEKPIPYPILANLFYFIYIVSVTGLIGHLITTRFASPLEEIKVDAEFHEIKSRLQRILKWKEVYSKHIAYALWLMERLKSKEKPIKRQTPKIKESIV